MKYVEPPASPHCTAVLLAARALAHAFGAGWFVQVHSPIILGRRSEPEPDVRRRWGYASVVTLGADAVIAPLAAPSASIPVADLLP